MNIIKNGIKHNVKEIFVFDVCDTLYYSNTTFDFIRYVLKQEGKARQLFYFELLTKRQSPIFIFFYFLQKVKNKDWQKYYALQLLRGLSKERLYSYGCSFVDDFLSSRRIAFTHDLLGTFNSSKGKSLLLSASIDPVIYAIAKKLGADFKSSCLEYDQAGYFTGFLLEEMTGQKLSTLRGILQQEDYRLTVATDNLTDRELVVAAHKRYVVVYNKKAKAFWQDLQPEFIDLYSK